MGPAVVTLNRLAVSIRFWWPIIAWRLDEIAKLDAA